MDNDPLVLAFARALLTSSPSRMLMGIMGHFTDDEAYPIVSRLPSDSYFALYDGASANEAFNQYKYNASSAVPYLRSPVLRGLDLVELGVAPIMQWRPDPGTEQAEIYSYSGVGHKPYRRRGMRGTSQSKAPAAGL